MIGLFLSCSSSYHTPSSLLFFNVSLKSEKKKKKYGTIHYTERHQSPWAPFSFLSAFSRLLAVLSLQQVLFLQNNPVLQITRCLLTMKFLLSKEFSSMNLFQCPDIRQTMATAYFFITLKILTQDASLMSPLLRLFSAYSPRSVSLPHILQFENIS